MATDSCVMNGNPSVETPRAAFSLRRIWVAIAAAFLAAALVMATMPATTEAARPIKFHLDLGWWCVAGRTTNNAWVKVVWKDSNGQLKQKGGTRASGRGFWRFCGDSDERLETGDIVRAKVGTRSRSISVPRLKLVIDRHADTVTGKAPAGETVTLDAQKPRNYDFWAWNAGRHVTSVTADSGGSFAVDYQNPSHLGYVLDLRGRDYIWASFTTPQGDRIMRGQEVPYRRIPWQGPLLGHVPCIQEAHRGAVARRCHDR